MPCIATKGEEQALFAPVNAAPSSPPSSAAPGHQPVNPSAATEEPAGPEQTTVPDDRFKDKPACRFEGEQAVNLPCIVTEGDVQLLLQTAAEDDGEEEGKLTSEVMSHSDLPLVDADPVCVERDSPNKNPLNIPLWLAVGRVEQLKKDMQYISNDLKGSEVTDNEYVDGAKARIEAALESKGGYEDNAEIERILDKMDDNDDRLGDDS